MIPQVVTYTLAASNATSVVNAVGATTLLLTGTTVTLDTQRRLIITAVGNESANTFTVKGTNQAGNAISESIAGPNGSTTQTNLDFKSVTSITAATTTATTVSVGGSTTGASLWQVVNWHVSPSNIAVSGVVVGTTAVNYSIQYTYDDPNNLPSGIQFPQAFTHPTIATATTSMDGAINDPITAWRVLINSGTGIVRATGIQAGIGGP